MTVIKTSLLAAVAAAALLASGLACAQVKVEAPWVQATVPQQRTTGAFLALTSARGGTLVDVSSPVATTVEVHQMKMDGDVMRMRPVDALPLPAGVRVELKPGVYHMMLMGLKAPVKAGDVVPLRLVVEDAKGGRETVDVQAVVRAGG